MKIQNYTLGLLMCLCLSLTAQVDTESARDQFTNAIQSRGYKATDIESFRITSEHVSSVSGIHHFYFMQEYQGIGIYNAVGSAHFNSNKQLIKTNVSFEGKMVERISTTAPAISAEAAIISAARELRYEYQGALEKVDALGGIEQKTTFRNQSLSLEDMPVHLMYQPIENGEIRLAWDISILEPAQTNWWSMRIDAETGKILDKTNWMVNCNFKHDHANEPAICNHPESKSTNATAYNSNMVGGYNVYAMPLQSPADGNRTLETDPDDATASPYGWHDTTGVAGAEFTTTQGNNVHAYEDGDNPGFSPDGGGGLVFDFSIDTIYSPGTQSEEAVITNLFYWNNVIHDVWYHYGFTEAAGNFQENNYGNGGIGSDYVFAEAQDGSGTCNANFGTPPDGENPRMQMYLCNMNGNYRDGDLDNLVIVHEYGHGISNRLTGGPAASGCLSNSEQMGEGWSDYLGLMMTIQAGDAGTDATGVGTWLFGESINGPGIRPFPYSTDMTINPHTYTSISSVSVPHGVGSVWCVMLWEMTWALIDQYGFDQDFYTGTGGNNIAMKLVLEGMKLQPCSPGFIDGRDAILLADQQLYGGANQCLIWTAFAKRGLGSSARQGSTASVNDGLQAFDTPFLSLEKSVNNTVVEIGDTLVYTLKLKNINVCNLDVTNIVAFDTIPNNTFYVPGSASNGGTESNGIVTFPTIASLSSGDSIILSFSVYVDPSYMLKPDVQDDIESGSGNWSTSTTSVGNDWAINTNNPISGLNAWFAADYGFTVDQYLTYNLQIVPSSTTFLNFWHDFDTESAWDGGVVQYSLDGGTNWLDIGPYFVQNGYNSSIDNSSSKPAFSGNSNGYISSLADLSTFAGQPLNIRFWMSCDPAVDGHGWYIDDFSTKSNLIQNTAYATADGGILLEAKTDFVEIQYQQCMDGIQNGDEEGIDCGGSFCPTCPGCSDGIQNGDETGVDCGGPDCAACPTCEDGIMNGYEEGVDCGGADCPACPCMQNDLTLSITVDNYPSETTWELKTDANVVIASGGPYTGTPSGTTINTDFCVTDDCYKFIIYDTFGDGICCFEGNGSYSLINNLDSTILASGGQFTYGDSTDFCVTAPPMGVCDSLLQANGIIAAGTYHAEYVLMSDGTVQSPDSVNFKAGAEIKLNPNFEVEMGAQFSAEIEACMAAMNLIRAKDWKKDATKEKNLLKKE